MHQAHMPSGQLYRQTGMSIYQPGSQHPGRKTIYQIAPEP
jgi:hypothetical protein